MLPLVIILNWNDSGADPVFLERGFICINVFWFYLSFLKYPMKMKLIRGRIQDFLKWFSYMHNGVLILSHFLRIFTTVGGGGGWGSSETPLNTSDSATVIIIHGRIQRDRVSEPLEK